MTGAEPGAGMFLLAFLSSGVLSTALARRWWHRHEMARGRRLLARVLDSWRE